MMVIIKRGKYWEYITNVGKMDVLVKIHYIWNYIVDV